MIFLFLWVLIFVILAVYLMLFGKSEHERNAERFDYNTLRKKDDAE